MQLHDATYLQVLQIGILSALDCYSSPLIYNDALVTIFSVAQAWFSFINPTI